jgi:hypothetical protein
MSSFIYDVGLNNAGSYIVSGIPWVKNFTVSGGAEESFTFYNVTKNIVVVNHDGSNSIRVHFASNSDPNVINNNHFYEVSAGEVLELDVKCETVYISSVSGANVSLFASITNIKATRMYELSGAGIDE